MSKYYAIRREINQKPTFQNYLCKTNIHLTKYYILLTIS